jgi:hypothetical protein
MRTFLSIFNQNWATTTSKFSQIRQHKHIDYINVYYTKLNENIPPSENNGHIISDNQFKQNTNIESSTFPYKMNVERKYSFCVHVRAKTMKSLEDLAIESLTEHILQAFIKGDQNTRLLSIPSKSYQQLAIKSIYLENNNIFISNYNRYTSCLETTNKGNIYGNLWFTSDTPYPTLKRSIKFRRHISTKFNIYFNINSLNTKTPTEIGY